MKTNKEIANLLLNRQEDFEPLIRAMNYTSSEFCEWMFSNTKREHQSYYVIGYLGMEWYSNDKKSAKKFHEFAIINRAGILEHYNQKFRL
jgi:hypothetical protein